MSIIPAKTQELPLLSSSDEVLTQLGLTDAEIAEAERLFVSVSMEDKKLLILGAMTTRNIGLQYLIVRNDNPNYIEMLAGNTSLHLEIVPMIIEHRQRNPLEPYNPMLKLALNQVVFSNLKLYKIIFSSLMEEKGALYRPLLKSMLSLRTDKKHDCNFGMSGVDTLLFLFSYIYNNQNDLDEYSISLVEKTGMEYKKEINAWIAAQHPDFVGLPLTWVLKAIDFCD